MWVGVLAHVGCCKIQAVPNDSFLSHGLLVTSSCPSDIYAIGVGKIDVDWKELNELSSKKDGERHAFILQDTQALSQVFEHMLGE